MTLIEIVIALLIVALLFSAVVMGVGALTGSSAKQATSELAGVIRSLYDTAALSGKTCRLVFELPPTKESEEPVRYRAECAAGNVTTSANRDDSLREDTQEAVDRAKNGGKSRFDELRSDSTPSLQEVMGQEKQRVEAATKFSEFTSPTIEPRDFPGSVQLSIWTAKQRDPVNHGLAYLYFFPQGFTERAMLHVRQGSNVWTLTVSPLTGKTAVVAEELEIPRS